MKEYCPHCHQAIMKNAQIFSKALGEILLTAACKYPANTPFHLQRDLTLTKSQYNNFQKLRYWGLVKKSYDGDGKRLGGFWELTGLAGAFINGKPIRKTKWTFNNEVVSASEEMIYLDEAVGSFDVPEQWAERAEPALALGQGSLL